MLALDYRPRTLDGLVGQRHVVRVLGRLLESAKLPAGLLLAGPRGCGKTTTARIVAAALNCENPHGSDPCGECLTCREIQAGRHSSTLEMDAASQGLVEDIRRLREQVLYAHDGKFRVVILDEAHSMSVEAFNALLKQLEEPPPEVLYILVTTRPDKILETVVSRLMGFAFRPLSTKAIEARLKYVAEKEGFELGDELCGRIAEYADGGMRDALMLMEQLQVAGDLTLDGFESLVGTISDELCAEVLRFAAQKDFVALSHIVDDNVRGIGARSLIEALTVLLVKVLRVHLGDKGRRQVAIDLADEVSQQQIVDLLQVMWDVRKLRHGRGQDRVTLQLAFALMCGDAPTKKAMPSQAKMSEDEMEGLFS